MQTNPEEKAAVDHEPASSAARRLLARVCRNPQTGRITIVQRPNAPLTLFLLASGVRAVADPSGRAGAGVTAIATGALAWWSVDEILRGDSPFRRGLGTVVLLGMLVPHVHASSG